MKTQAEKGRLRSILLAIAGLILAVTLQKEYYGLIIFGFACIRFSVWQKQINKLQSYHNNVKS